MEPGKRRLSQIKGDATYQEAFDASEALLRAERTRFHVLSSNGMKRSLHPVGSRASQAFHPVGRLCRVTALTTPIREIVQCFAAQITPFGHISLVLCISHLSTGGSEEKRTGYQVTHYIEKDGPFEHVAEKLVGAGFTLTTADVGLEERDDSGTNKSSRKKYTWLRVQSKCVGKTRSKYKL